MKTLAIKALLQALVEGPKAAERARDFLARVEEMKARIEGEPVARTESGLPIVKPGIVSAEYIQAAVHEHGKALEADILNPELRKKVGIVLSLLSIIALAADTFGGPKVLVVGLPILKALAGRILEEFDGDASE
jgi:hypothetical protein